MLCSCFLNSIHRTFLQLFEDPYSQVIFSSPHSVHFLEPLRILNRNVIRPRMGTLFIFFLHMGTLMAPLIGHSSVSKVKTTSTAIRTQVWETLKVGIWHGIFCDMLCLHVLSESNTEVKISVYCSYHQAGTSSRSEPLKTINTTAASHDAYLDLWLESVFKGGEASRSLTVFEKRKI